MTVTGRVAAEVQRLQLDLLASRCSEALQRNAIPHALLKGPTTAIWLYHPPRGYSDVDLLVPATRLPDAVRTLDLAGLAHPTAGRFGEQAAHSQLLVAPRGFEVDLHGTLPTLTIDRRDPDRVWRVLSGLLHPFDLGEGIAPVPALTEPARAVVLALHALGCGPNDGRVREDLRRAAETLGPDGWQQARAVAVSLGVSGRFDAMTAVLNGTPLPPVDRETALWLSGAPGIEIQLARLRGLPPPERLRTVIREAFPSSGFMRTAYPETAGSRSRLAGRYLTRLARLGRDCLLRGRC